MSGDSVASECVMEGVNGYLMKVFTRKPNFGQRSEKCFRWISEEKRAKKYFLLEHDFGTKSEKCFRGISEE